MAPSRRAPSPVLLWASLIVSFVNLAVILTPRAWAQRVMTMVQLQATSPGSAQIGNANVTGTVSSRASSAAAAARSPA